MRGSKSAGLPRLVALLIPLVFAWGGCGRIGGGASAPDGIVLITVDALRPDLLALYGGPVATPNLERLASSATVYDDAVTPCPLVRPAVASAMTGVAPDRLQVRDNLADRLAPEAVTLAEGMRARGWRTAAFVGTRLCSIAASLDQGFELFDGPADLTAGPGAHYPRTRSPQELTANLASWLASLAEDERFFVWIHMPGLHGLSVDPDVKDPRAAYEKALKGFDEHLGLLLDAVALRDRRVQVMLAGTHGTHLGEEGKRGEAYWLDPETLRVPLIWRQALGDAAKTSRDPRPVWLPDVAVTLAAAAGADLGDRLDGADLAADPQPSRARYAFSWAPDDELAWPNLQATRKDGVWHWGVRDRPATPRPRTLPPALGARIEEAGVRLGGAVSAEPLPTAEQRSTLLSRLAGVRHQIGSLKAVPAIQQGRKMTEDYPSNLAVMSQWLYLNIAAGSKGAEKLAHQLLEVYPNRADVLHWAAHAALLNDNVDRAERLLLGAEAVGPVEPDVLYDLACTRARSGDAEGAFRYLGRSIEAGFRDWEYIEKDPDLASIRPTPQYAALLRSHGR